MILPGRRNDAPRNQRHRKDTGMSDYDDGSCCTPDSGDCCGPGSWCCKRAGKHDHDDEQGPNK